MGVNNRKSTTFLYKIQFLKIYYTMIRENCTFINKKNMKIEMFVFLYTCRKFIVMIILIMSKKKFPKDHNTKGGVKIF